MMKQILIICFSSAKERWLAISLFYALLISITVSSALAVPYKPTSIEEVVQPIPPSIAAISRQRNDDTGIRRASSKSNSLTKARYFITLAKRDNNNRWYGFARSSIQPWIDNINNDPEISLIKSHLHLLAHNFEQALSELNKVLEWRDDHPEALIMRANTYLMLSQYEKARRDCQRVTLLSNPVLGINCLARTNALTGSAEKALEQVLAVLKLASTLGPLERFESHLNAAIFAHRLNKVSLAKQHYREAHVLKPNNAYLLEHYSDFLIEHDQWPMLEKLISKNTDNLGQRIKLARYLIEFTEQSAQSQITQIENEFVYLKNIKDNFPHKDYANFFLTLKQDPLSALAASLTNWDEQKDPSGALLVLRCAMASRKPVSAQLTIDWVRHTKLNDHRIEDAINSLTKMHTAL